MSKLKVGDEVDDLTMIVNNLPNGVERRCGEVYQIKGKKVVVRWYDDGDLWDKDYFIPSKTLVLTKLVDSLLKRLSSDLFLNACV